MAIPKKEPPLTPKGQGRLDALGVARLSVPLGYDKPALHHEHGGHQHGAHADHHREVDRAVHLKLWVRHVILFSIPSRRRSSRATSSWCTSRSSRNSSRIPTKSLRHSAIS